MHSLLLVDDQPAFLRLARTLLHGHSDLAVLGEATSTEEALALLPILRPKVVILDVQMPGLNGFQAARRLLAAAPELRIILVSALGNPQYEPLARAVGAVAFLPKKALSAEAIVRLLQQP